MREKSKFIKFKEQFFSKNKNKHTFKGSIIRHVVIEKLLYKLQKIHGKFFDLPFYFPSNFFYLPINLLFGLNCNFPLKHIGIFIIWTLTPIKIVKKRYELIEKIKRINKNKTIPHM